MTDIPWMENDELFRSEYAEGKAGERIVAEILREFGFTVEVSPEVVREHVSQREAYKDEFDLRVGKEKKITLDVKSMRKSFTTIEEFPYGTITVIKKKVWDDMKHKPAAVLLYSRPTGSIFVAPAKFFDQWLVREVKNKLRGFSYDAYVAPMSALVSLERFVEVLREAGIE